ncbi:MAG: transposase [Verrucomicrobia bacterium]|jgi:hypothetical protein|nr:transposase [Verrucomicrobiota bacterium]
MAKYRTLKPRKFTVEFRDWRQASAHGGQLAVAGLLEQFGLKERVLRARDLDPRTHLGKGYVPLVYVTQVLFSFTSGGVSLADAERLNDDGPLKAFLGIEKFPDQTALGEWLRDIGEPGWQALRRLNRDFVQWAFARAEPARYQHAGRTEAFFDDTQIEVSGSSFEGAAMNYEGNLALSWQVLLVGPFLADQVLGATSDTKESPASDQAGKDVSNRLPELLEANAHLWQKEPSYLYTDSASSAGKYLECIARHFDAWSVSYNRWTGPLETKAAELPEWAWSAAQNLKWRDGSEHTAQYAWFRHQPGGCESPQRFAVVRHRPAGEMFWRYAFLTAQEQEGSAQRAFERHRLKGDKERVLSELLSDLDLHHPPCANLNANRSFYTLAVLAWNVMQALKLLHLPEGEAPKRMRTLLRHLLLIPVELKRHARSLKACVYAPAGWVAWWRGLLSELMPRCRVSPAVLASGSG